MLDLAETIVHCALNREESRGAHQRRDFPKRDDNKYLAHSVVYRNAEGRTANRISAGCNHALAAGRTDLWKAIISEVALWPTRSSWKWRVFFLNATPNPSYQSFEVPLRSDWMILDALNYIKDNLDGSLGFRWSCRMGICGSCGMMVNGVPQLTCETLLTTFAPGPVRVGPLEHFPIIKDLGDRDGGLSRQIAESSGPGSFVTTSFKPEREFIQSPDQLEMFKQYTLCINCMLCYAACPVYGLDPSFTGPAAIALAERYNLDSRDQGAEERHRRAFAA